MSNMNPYEVRLEVLDMAKTMVEIAYQDANSLAWEMTQKVAEYQNKTMADMQEYLDALRKPMFTTKEIIQKAEELYTFVTKKD